MTEPNLEALKELNLMPAIDRGYKADFLIAPNILGCSASPFGYRRNVISNRKGLSLEFKNQLLSGSMMHRCVDKDTVIYEMTKDINETGGFIEKEIRGKRYIKLENGNWMEFEALSEEDWVKKYPKLIYIHFGDGYYLRMHPDIYTSLYCIETKTTNKIKAMWGDLAAYQINQLNLYLGILHLPFGLLLKIDLGATKENEYEESHGGFFNSGSKRYSFIWNRYFYLHVHKFDQDLFDYSIDRIKYFFKCMKENIELDKIPCPEFLFSCENDCMKYCPNPIEKVKKIVENEVCAHCKQEIRAGSNMLLRNDQSYHHTNESKERYEDCISAAKKAWRVSEK